MEDDNFDMPSYSGLLKKSLQLKALYLVCEATVK